MDRWVLPINLHFSLLTNEYFYCTICWRDLSSFWGTGVCQKVRFQLVNQEWRWGCQGWTEGSCDRCPWETQSGFETFFTINHYILLPLTGMTVSLAVLVKMSDFFFLPGYCPWEGLQLNWLISGIYIRGLELFCEFSVEALWKPRLKKVNS